MAASIISKFDFASECEVIPSIFHGLQYGQNKYQIIIDIVLESKGLDVKFDWSKNSPAAVKEKKNARTSILLTK